MSQLVDELLGTADHVTKILNNSQEYQNAINRINEIIESPTANREEKVKAHSLGMALKRAHSSPLDELMKSLMDRMERPAYQTGETNAEEEVTLFHFGQEVWYVEDDGHSMGIIHGRVIGCDHETVCISDDQGDTQWLTRRVVYPSRLLAAQSI